MDFELSDEQVALVDGVRSFCEGRFPIATVRSLADDGGVRRDLWRELGDLGLFSLRMPGSDGGADLGWADAVLAFEQLGRALVPGPLVWTHLVAALVPGAATGEVVVGGIDRDDPSGVLEYPGVLDVLMVVDDTGLWSVDATALEVHELTPLDPLTPVGRLAAPLPRASRCSTSRAWPGCRSRGPRSRRPCSSGSPRPPPSSRSPTPRTVTSSVVRSGPSRASSTSWPTCSPGVRSPEAPSTRPG
jgi:hypothetical protein